MSEKQATGIGKLDLDRLTDGIEGLIALCERLQEENSLLRAQQAKLQSERLRLAEKNELSRHKLEGMITRLKSLEIEL